MPEICFALSQSRLNKLPPRKMKKLNASQKKELQSYFSDRAISVSEDIGVSQYLHEYIRLGIQKRRERKLFIMKEAHEILSLTHLELASMLAMIDCERDRAMQLASQIDLIRNKEIDKLTFYSISFTVAGTSMAAALELAGLSNSVYLGADVLLGIISAYNGAQVPYLQVTGKLETENNLLNELIQKPDKPKLFYESVWNFLVDETFPEEISERDEIIRIWAKDGSTSEDEKLFFSKGGEYTAIQLYRLVQRLDTLKTRTAFMNLELRQLQDELSDLELELLN